MDSGEAQRAKKSYRGWWIAAGVVVLAVAIVALLWLNGQRRLQRKIEQLHAKGFPITFEEIEQKRRLPDGTPNAADLYQQAFDAFQEPSDQDKPLLPYFSSNKFPEPNEPLSEEITAAIERFLYNNQQSMAVIKQAIDTKHCSFMLNFTTSPMPDLVYLNELNRCGRLLLLEGLIRIERDDIKGTVEIIRDRIQMASSLKREPFIIDCLVHHSMSIYTLWFVERFMNNTTIDRQSLVDLDHSIQECIPFHQLEDAFRNELPTMLLYLKDPSLLSMQGIGNSPVRGLSIVVQSNIKECIDWLEMMVAICQSSPHEQFEYINTLPGETLKLSFLREIAPGICSSWIHDMKMDLRLEAQVDSARAAIAVERFRLDMGKIPERLEELVPKYMEKVPIDPFDGKPLRYKRLDKGYTIYSIGEDCKDDGGKKKIRGDKDFDYPFTIRR